MKTLLILLSFNCFAQFGVKIGVGYAKPIRTFDPAFFYKFDPYFKVKMTTTGLSVGIVSDKLQSLRMYSIGAFENITITKGLYFTCSYNLILFKTGIVNNMVHNYNAGLGFEYSKIKIKPFVEIQGSYFNSEKKYFNGRFVPQIVAGIRF